jgi:lipoate-protein ligase A
MSLCGQGEAMNKLRTSNLEPRTSNASSGDTRPFKVQSSKFKVQGSSAQGPGPAAFNMALDEALLEAMSRLGRPVLRFYGWTEPAATFGYFQKYADVERATLLRPLIRRPTGGGIVPHDADWTYSLAFPPGHKWHSLKAEASYRRVHEWIQSAFAKLNIETELAPRCKKSVPNSRSSRREEALESGSQPSTLNPQPGNQSLLTSAATSVLPGQCFAGHEKSDVLWHGRKIAGAAQRRNKLGLLIQGSVQSRCIGISPARPDWQKAMSDVGHDELGIEWSDFEPDQTLRERAELLARQKYSQSKFICKR